MISKKFILKKIWIISLRVATPIIKTRKRTSKRNGLVAHSSRATIRGLAPERTNASALFKIDFVKANVDAKATVSISSSVVNASQPTNATKI